MRSGRADDTTPGPPRSPRRLTRAAGALVALAVAASLTASAASLEPSTPAVFPAPGIGLHHQIVDNAAAIRAAEIERVSIGHRLADRVVDIYRSEPPGALHVVLSSESLSEAMEAYRMLERISGHDNGLAQAVQDAHQRLIDLRAERQALLAAWRDRMAALALCESNGDPRAISPDGRYRGKYQFDVRTWRGAGGRGDPAEAPEAEQDRRAAQLYRERGPAPWPVCGPLAG